MGHLARAAILLPILVAGVSAHADEALFKAMSMMALGAGMPDVLPPTVQDGNYVDIRFSGVTAFGDVLSPGPNGCSIVQTSVTQDRGEFAQISVKTYDFSKITGIRYLGSTDDFVKAPSREPDDQAVDTISLDGKAWQCQRVVHVDPAKPHFAQHCDDGWQITLIGAEDKRVAREAIELIQASCFAR